MISMNIADPSTLGRIMGLTICCAVLTVLLISPGIRLGMSLIYPGKERSDNHSRVNHNKQRQTTMNQQPVLLYSESSPEAVSGQRQPAINSFSTSGRCRTRRCQARLPDTRIVQTLSRLRSRSSHVTSTSRTGSLKYPTCTNSIFCIKGTLIALITFSPLHPRQKGSPQSAPYLMGTGV